uniref:Uncharacterized protein n=1 Tax=Glossina morsitans morsitans TaxID=37546 RepID=A0A1B0GA22_GLOMM
MDSFKGYVYHAYSNRSDFVTLFVLLMYSTWHKVKVNLPNRYNQIIHLVQCDQKRYNAHSPINKRTNTHSHREIKSRA